MIALSFLSGELAGRVLELDEAWITLGRAPQCEVVVPDPQCSWEHCVIERVAAGYLITDLGSRNGTFVGDDDAERVAEPTVLRPGDVVRLGETRIRVTYVPLAMEPTLDGGAAVPEATISAVQSIHGDVLALTMVSGDLIGDTFVAAADVVTMGSAADADIRLPGTPPQAAWLVRDGDRYVIQPAVEGARDVLVDGAFVTAQAAITDRAIVQVGRHTLQAEYVPTDDVGSAATREMSQASADNTLRMSRDEAQGALAAAARAAADPDATGVLDVNATRGAIERARQQAEEDNRTLRLDDAGGRDIAAEVQRYAAERRRRDAARQQTAWARITAADTVVLDRLPGEDEEPVPRHIRLRPRLRFVAGPHELRHVFLGTAPVHLGRADGNDVVLFDVLVSSRHARVTVDEDGRVTLADVGGKNPISINGQPLVRPQVLEHGDLVSIGATVMEFGAPGIDPDQYDPMSTVALPQPRFSFGGHVLVQPTLTIGRDPMSHLFLDDDEAVDRHHADIDFTYGEFRVRDLGDSGTYVNGERVVERKLTTGDEISVGRYRIKVAIEAFSCALDIASPAPAAQETFAADFDSADPFRTMYRMALPRPPSDQSAVKAGEEPPPPPRKKVTWVPPWDTRRTWRKPLMAGSGVVLALGLVALLGVHRGTPFLSRPISSPHNSAAFATRAEAEHGGASCAACHAPFGGVELARCAGCHEPQKPQEAHARTAGADTCLGCHLEHPTGTEPAKLLAVERCAGCHEDRHERLLAVTPGPVQLEAPADAVRPGATAEDLHRIHAAIERRCAGCHANQDQSGPVDPRTSCARCHGPAERFRETACFECHQEHPASRAEAESVAGGGGPFAAPPPEISIGYGLLLALPLLLVLGLHRVAGERTRRRPEEGPAEEIAAPKKLIHIMDEPCVGCGECVEACPYEVLALKINGDGKKVARVINFDSCNECNTCAEVCKPNALTRRPPGAPIPMIERADLDAHYMTSVAGLYLIGEAGGKSQLRNANNLGARTIKHLMYDGVVPGTAKAMGLDYDVLIVGAGPGGISAGITAANVGLGHAVLEKGPGVLRTLVEHYPKGKPTQSQPASVANIGALPMWNPAEHISKEEVLGLWEAEIAKHPVNFLFRQEVTKLEPLAAPDAPCAGFRVTTSRGEYTAVRVILAIGTRGSPRRLSRVPGNELDKVRYALPDPDAHDGDDVVVVGGGNSALEAAVAIALANDRRNRVTLVYRGEKFDKASQKNVAEVEALVKQGRLTLRTRTNPVEISEKGVKLKHDDGGEDVVKNDWVYCMLGADAPSKWLKSLGVRFAEKPQGWSPGPSDDLSFLDLK